MRGHYRISHVAGFWLLTEEALVFALSIGAHTKKRGVAILQTQTWDRDDVEFCRSPARDGFVPLDRDPPIVATVAH